MSRRLCFITPTLRRGFTAPSRRSLRLRGLLMPCTSAHHVSSLSFSFGPSSGSTRLLRPLLTSHSGQARRPFRHEARAPQVRARSFTAQSPHLRHLALTTRASQPFACSPCLAAPQMRFVYLDSRFRSTLPSHARSPSRSCVSLRSLWSACGRTCTSKIAPMLGAQNGKHELVFDAPRWGGYANQGKTLSGDWNLKAVHGDSAWMAPIAGTFRLRIGIRKAVLVNSRS